MTIDADIDTLNNVILGGTDNKHIGGDLIITGDFTVKNNIDLRMYESSSRDLYHTIDGLPTKTFKLENGARIINSTPSSAAKAFPEGFGTYSIDDNSTVYLYSNDTYDQTLFTESSIQYGNIYAYYDKNITLDGVADLYVKGDVDFNNSTLIDNGRNLVIGGANVIIPYYTPSSDTVTLTLNGSNNQYLRDDQENNLILSNLVCGGAGVKTIGDGNDAITINGDFTNNSGVTATTNRSVTFIGSNWLNNGVFTHTGNRTISFVGSDSQTIDPGAPDPANNFRNVVFNNSNKTFINNGADVDGNFYIYSDTVNLGNLEFNISGRIKNTAGGTLLSENASFIFDGGNQNIITPDFAADDITISGNGTKRQFSDWTIKGDLLINPGVYLNTADSVDPANYYDINIAGNWTNNGNFVDNTSRVTFIGSNSPIEIVAGNSNFYDVTFTPSSPVNYNLQSPSTRFARSMTLESNATLNLNSNILVLGSYLSSGKTHTIDGTLNINENATLRVNNQNSQSVINVGGTLQIVGTDNSNIASLTRENAGSAGNETQINILSGGTLAARYYLIEYLQDEGLDMASGSTTGYSLDLT
jgi:hypothetical protein